MRRCGRSMNRKDRDGGAEMRLTERTRKLIPETRCSVPEGAISYTYSQDDDGLLLCAKFHPGWRMVWVWETQIFQSQSVLGFIVM